MQSTPRGGWFGITVSIVLSFGMAGVATAEPEVSRLVAEATQCGAHVYSTVEPSLDLTHFADGPAASARFYHPSGIASDGHGNLYVADTGNYVIRRISRDGMVTTLAGTPGHQGCADGVGPKASFYGVESIAVDRDGVIWLADSGTNSIRRITAAGEVSTLTVHGDSSGGRDLHGAQMSLENHTPMGIAVDGSNLYVTLQYAILKISPTGTESVLAGSPVGYPVGTPGWADQMANRDGIGTAARFASVQGIAVAPTGALIVTDPAMDLIKAVSATGAVTLLAGSVYDHAFAQATSRDGVATDARFFVPQGAAVDPAGTIYVADRRNGTIRAIAPTGMVSTLAGTPHQGGSQDGMGPEARFIAPWAVAVDHDGNVVVADRGDNTIRKVTPAGMVTTIAGLSAYRAKVEELGNAPAEPAPVRSEPGSSESQQLASEIALLLMPRTGFSPEQVAAALKLPMDEFRWSNDQSGGWASSPSPETGVTHLSASIGYRRAVANDGSVPTGPMQAPYRAAYISLTLNLPHGTCLSAADVAMATHAIGKPFRTPEDLAKMFRTGQPAAETGVEFDLPAHGDIRTVIELDAPCAHGLWIHRWNYTGQELPIPPDLTDST